MSKEDFPFTHPMFKAAGYEPPKPLDIPVMPDSVRADRIKWEKQLANSLNERLKEAEARYPIQGTFTRKTLETLAYFYTNTDRSTLEDVGIIKKGPSGDTGWNRFNHNFDIFILKLDDEKQEALACLVNKYFRAVGGAA